MRDIMNTNENDTKKKIGNKNKHDETKQIYGEKEEKQK